MNAKKRFQIECAVGSDPLTDNTIQYMPAGISWICPSMNGRPVDVVVEVDAQAADELNHQLEVFAERGLKPYLSIGDDSHASDTAAFWPEKFFWATRADATGKMVQGVWCQGQWSDAGRAGVVGKNFRSFSPTFFVDELSVNPRQPARITANENANPNMGALINDPAFTNISPLWAKQQPEQKENMKTNSNSACPRCGGALRIVSDDDNELESGAAGSGRYKRPIGHKGADMISEAAQRASRQAQRDGTVEAHVRAGDLNRHAGSEMKEAGRPDRADDHFEKASAHYAIAKTLQGGDLNAGRGDEFDGRPTVTNPKGSDANFSDKGEYGSLRRENLSEGGGAGGGDYLHQKLADEQIKCPSCNNLFTPTETVSGKNSARIVCPFCSGSFYLDTGRSIGTQSVE